jgi:hypothetical protein
MKQSITGNKMFMKRTILPITKKIGVKRVKVKIIPPQLPDDKDKIEISFDLDKNQNDELLKLLQKKIGKKRSMKRKKLNISVFKEKKSQNEAKEITRTKARLLKMNAKYLADDLMDMYKELSQSDIDSVLIVQHLDTLNDKVKMMRRNVGLR